MKAIYGYGSPRFRLGDGEAVFGAHQGAGQVEFEPIGHEFETLAGDLIEVPRGWRATAKLRLLNVKNLDYAPHLKLIQLINLSRSTGLPLKCKPRFENGMQLELAVKLRGNFGYAELTNLNAGQSIELEFVAVRLLVSAGLCESARVSADRDGQLSAAERRWEQASGARN